MLKYVLGAWALCSVTWVWGQTGEERAAPAVFVNPSVDKTIPGPDFNALLGTLNGFFASKNQSPTQNGHWLPADLERWVYPYLDVYNQEHSAKNNNPAYYRSTWIQVLRGDTPDGYVVKVAYMGQESDRFSSLKFIYNLYAQKADGHFLLSRSTDYVTRRWKRVHIGNITFIVHPDRTLDSLMAQATYEYSKSLATYFETEPIAFTYYSCRNAKQVFEVRGFEYTPNMYFDETGGMCEAYNQTVFSGQNSEWYPHEMVHLYTHKVFGNNLNRLADEGVATYLGGSDNITLDEHIHIVKQHKLAHADWDLEEALYTDTQVGENTSAQYTLSGILCRRIFENKGKVGLKRWLSAGNTETGQAAALKEVLGIEPGQLNKFLLAELLGEK